MTGELDFDDDDGSAELRRAWELCLHLLVNKVAKVTFETFIRPIRPLGFEDGCVRLGVASAYNKDWLEKKSVNAIRSALEFHLDASDLRVELVVIARERRNADSRTAARSQKPTEADGQAALAIPADEPAVEYTTSVQVAAAVAAPRRVGGKADAKPTVDAPPLTPCMTLNPDYRLDNFVDGPSNRLAFAGASEVAARPGEAYNPLFIYGQPGLGKTHLLQGIAHGIRNSQPDLRVAYVSGEYFAQHFIGAIRDHVTETFRRQYRETDVWLVDDIQFIATMALTKDEFFHTFDALHRDKRQIVIAADRSPRDLTAMDERMRSRFQSGLIADMDAPEPETRLEILRRRCRREQIEVPVAVLEYIAGAIQSNIRALEGALTKLFAYSSIMKAPISPELARRVLTEYYIEKQIRTRRITVDDVIDAVADTFGSTSEAIKGPTRNKEIALARHVAMYLCREMLPEVKAVAVGSAFGGRDHATVVHACKKLQAILAVDEDIVRMVKELKQRLDRVGST